MKPKLLFKLKLKREEIQFIRGKKKTTKQPKLIALLRERNEELILKDTLDHLATIADAIVVFDDDSTDSSVVIAKQHPAVAAVLVNKKWRKDRPIEETRHRGLLLDYARLLSPSWILYSDADERFEGDIRGFVDSAPNNVLGVRIMLLDAYMTPTDNKPYTGGPLLDFRSSFGPEQRNIIMLWKNTNDVRYDGLDMREPLGIPEENIITKFYCQHYGKALSEEHWEATCDYYINFFPGYSEKWLARKGKSIHTRSDFDTPLFSWSEAKKHAIQIHPI